MKIAIIGSGWVGCHLALSLKDEHDVSLYDKNDDVFCGTSLYNQNRLHLGYHYARSHKTRMLCKNTFNLFLENYGHVTDVIHNNLYAVPKYNSIIDFDTYLKIFDDHKHDAYSSDKLKNLEGCIIVDERYINPQKSKEHFKERLSNIIYKENITEKTLKQLSKDFDLVINSTNNFLTPDTENTFWELCIMMIYDRKQPLDFNALTLVDGSLFSIYPYLNNTVTLSHVIYTPILKRKVPVFDDVIINVSEIRNNMELDVKKYFPDFHDYFKYCDFFKSIKIKRDIKSDDRTPVCNINNNIINCYTGKIQGIFYIEQFIKNEISNR